MLLFYFRAHAHMLTQIKYDDMTHYVKYIKENNADHSDATVFSKGKIIFHV